MADQPASHVRSSGYNFRCCSCRDSGNPRELFHNFQLTIRGCSFYDDDYVHSWCKGSDRFDFYSAEDNVTGIHSTASGDRRVNKKV